MKNANSTAILRAQEVAYRYAGNGHTLPPVSLEVAAGACLAIIGESGCGKSTLARCLTGLIPHLYRGEMNGAVWIEDLRTAMTPLWQLSERAGMVFQNPAAQMLATTTENELIFGLENLGLARAEIATRLEDALAQFGLAALRKRDPRSLSGGETTAVGACQHDDRRPAVLVLVAVLDARWRCRYEPDAAGRIGGARDGYRGMRHRLSGWAAAGIAHAAPDLTTTHPEQRVQCPTGAKRAPYRSGAGLGVRRDDTEVLHNLDFCAHGGEVVAIVGRNGAGRDDVAASAGRLTTGGGAQS